MRLRRIAVGVMDDGVVELEEMSRAGARNLTELAQACTVQRGVTGLQTASTR